MLSTKTFLTLALGGLIVGATLLAQEGEPEMPKPTKEHQMLKERVGTWNAEFKMNMGPQTDEHKATMTWSMLGDFWLLGNYEGGTFMGQPFRGQELSTFDPATKKFVSYWIDSTSPMISVSSGTWDEATSTMTQTSTTVDPMWGAKTISKAVVRDANTVMFSMTPEGADAAAMEIKYTRKP